MEIAIEHRDAWDVSSVGMRFQNGMVSFAYKDAGKLLNPIELESEDCAAPAHI